MSKTVSFLKEVRLPYLLLFALLPFSLLIEVDATLDPYKYPRWLFLLVLVCGAYIFYLFKNSVKVSKSYLILFSVSVGLVVASSLVSEWGFSNYFALVKLLYVFVLFLLMAGVKKQERRLLSYSLLAMLGYVVLQTDIAVFNSGLTTMKDIYRIDVLFGHKNILSGAMLLLAVHSVSGWSVFGKKTRLFLIVILANTVAILLLLQARSVLLGGIVCLIVGAFTMRKQFQLWYKPALGIFLLGAVLTVLMYSKGSDRSLITEKYKVSKIGGKSSSGLERIFIWKNTLDMISDHPVFGVGLGNWKRDFPKYGVSNSRAENGYINFLRPHNDYLWIIAEMGVLGLASILAFIIVLISSFSKYWSGENKMKLLPVLAFMIISVFSFPSERALLLTLLILALPVGSMKSYIVPKIAIGGMTVLVLGAVLLLINRLQGDIYAEELIVAHSKGRSKKMLELSQLCEDKGYVLDDNGTAIAFYQGVAFSDLNQNEKALKSFVKAKKYAPYHVHVLNNLAGTYYRLNEVDSCKKHYEIALKISPYFDEVLINYAAILFNEGDVKRAYELITKCPGNSNHPNYNNYKEVITKSFLEENQ